jgi:hypothetical protein
MVIKARVLDSTHLELSQPITARPGETVLVSLAPLIEDTERQEWLSASLSGLNAAYSDDEPEYSISMVKARNPDYKG